MKITFSTGRLDKIHISVDGEYRYTVDADYWYTCRWRKADEITDKAECDEFFKDIGSRYAFISGLRLLDYADHSRKELRLKLVNKGHKPEYVDAALDNLEEYGYINDMRFAENKADYLIRHKHMSRNGIKSELMRKGVSREIVNQVVESLECDPQEEIQKLLSTKYRRYLDDEKGRKKTVAGLQRLGYSWSDIKTAMNRYTSDMEDEFYD